MKDKDGNHINDFWDSAYAGIFSSKHTDGSNPPKYYGNYTDKWYPWDNWYSSPMFWFKWIGITILVLIVLGISTCTYHHHKYKCIRGHYHTSYDRFDNKDYIWHCDEEVLRTEYNKNPSKYPNADDGCNCNH